MTPNPFTFGNPIREPERFIGRTQEIRQIVNRLLSSAHESTSIVGERRIGKTSLLYHLAEAQTAKDLGLTPEHFCMVYVDFQGLTDITPQRFWSRVLEKIARSACVEPLVASIRALDPSRDLDLFDLEDIFDVAVSHGLTIVLMMDEFEYITQNPHFPADFFGGLRSLAIHHGLALLPATRQELVDLCHSEEIKGSPFFNIFANVVLRPFAPAETRELVRRYTSGSEIQFGPVENELVLELGGGYPFFTQMAGNYIMESRLQGIPPAEQKKFVLEHFDAQADPHYMYLWSHCAESEKIALLILMGLALQKPTTRTTATLENLTGMRPRIASDLTALVKRGLVLEEGGRYRIFSHSFLRWIQRELLADAGEEEADVTVDAWLDSGGYKDLKMANKVLPRFKKKYWSMIGNMAKDIALKVAVGGAIEMIKVLVI